MYNINLFITTNTYLIVSLNSLAFFFWPCYVMMFRSLFHYFFVVIFFILLFQIPSLAITESQKQNKTVLSLLSLGTFILTLCGESKAARILRWKVCFVLLGSHKLHSCKLSCKATLNVWYKKANQVTVRPACRISHNRKSNNLSTERSKAFPNICYSGWDHLLLNVH